MPGNPKTSPKRISAQERQLRALYLRKSGATFEAIAQQLGFKSRQAASYAVDAALKKTIQKPADEVRKLDLERLDMMLLCLMPNIKLGDHNAVNSALRILARRAKLLGLDAPVVEEHIVKDGDKPDLSKVPDKELDDAIEAVERYLGIEKD